MSASISLDAGDRQRISQITTLGDYKVVGADRGLLLDNVGTGTVVHSNNKVLMAVAPGQYQIRHSHRYHLYFSGKSQLVECTFDSFQSEAGVTKRIGYFSSNAAAPYNSTLDGFWLESADNKVTLKVSRAGTEVLSQELRVWDNGPNHVYDWSNFTVVLFDFLWLGGAVLRVWVKTSVGFVLAYEYKYAGTQRDTFIKSPSQTLRYELRSTTGDGSMRYICAQVATEGSTQESGSSRSVDTGATAISLATIGTRYPLKAVRKKTAQRDVGVRAVDIAVYASSANDIYRWELCLNPTLSSGLAYSDVANSAIQQADGNGTITATAPGTVLASGYLGTDVPLPHDILEDNYLAYLGSTIADVMDQLVLVVTPITGNVSMFGAILVKEY